MSLVIAVTMINVSAADDTPVVEHVAPVASDIVGLTITAGHIEYGKQIPYVPEDGDVVTPDEQIHRWVYRDGECIGSLVGPDKDILCTLDRLVGEPVDADRADDSANYAITSPDDPSYLEPRQPDAVYRKTKPSDLGMVGPFIFDAPKKHVVYLRFPKPMTLGATYEIDLKNLGLPPQTFSYQPKEYRSEAVHVSHVGFRPDDPAKVAFLSLWLGSGGPLDYEPNLRFQVLDDATDKPVYEGTTALSKAAGGLEDVLNKNYNKTDVYEMDFSALDRPGTYRICVEGIGCSYPFEIAEDAWRKAFYVAARGFYHQRSGIPLGPPYTTFERPRPFHPDDGLKVYASTTPLMDSGNGLNSDNDTNFGNLVKGKTGEIVPDAWGGYMDAGDWDRRIQHLRASIFLLELAGLFPDYFGGLSLNIPESNDGLPDIVSEALFNIDGYRRMQTADGGIRGGIESEEHPRRGECSWQESLTVLAYAPGVYSSYTYAGVAARAAHVLAAYNTDRAAVYRESALRAMDWAENNLERARKENVTGNHPAVRHMRNYAAVELFRLTGEAKWHDLFVATTDLEGSGAPTIKIEESFGQGDAAWVYARLDMRDVDEGLQRACRRALTDDAALRVASVERTGFRWAKHGVIPVFFGTLSSAEDAVCLIRAHALTNDRKYLRAAVLACQTSAGANPVNICYTTGVGHKYPIHPLNLDSRLSRQPAPPGLTPGGPIDSTHPLATAFSMFQNMVIPHIEPPIKEWPVIESFWDVFWHALVCEYTVHKPMAGHAYVWGYLAARNTASN